MVSDLKGQCIIDVRGLPCIDNPLEFFSQTPGATNHYWDFNGEGFNNTTPSPKFTFNTLGAKIITYICTLPNGQKCTTTLNLFIKDKPKLRLN